MTMGALHEGHATLVREARTRARHRGRHDLPQPAAVRRRRGPRRYPRTLDADLELWRAEGVDLVFAPTPDVVYPDGDPGVRVSAGPLGDVLEGASRPGHFDGVLDRRGQAAPPRPAGRSPTSGRRTPSSCCLIRRMVRDLDFPIEVVAVPTVREPDGLAMSSRNAYLTDVDREVGAGAVPRARRGRRRPRRRAPAPCVGPPATCLVAEPLCRVDYLALVHPTTLDDVPEWYSRRGAAGGRRPGRVDPTDRQRPAHARGPDHRSRPMMRTMMHGEDPPRHGDPGRPALRRVGDVDADLLDAADLLPGRAGRRRRRHQRGAADDLRDRGRRGSGEICINGAAAHLVHPGDVVIIIGYALRRRPRGPRPRSHVVFVDGAEPGRRGRARRRARARRRSA